MANLVILKRGVCHDPPKDVNKLQITQQNQKHSKYMLSIDIYVLYSYSALRELSNSKYSDQGKPQDHNKTWTKSCEILYFPNLRCDLSYLDANISKKREHWQIVPSAQVGTNHIRDCQYNLFLSKSESIRWENSIVRVRRQTHCDNVHAKPYQLCVQFKNKLYYIFMYTYLSI